MAFTTFITYPTLKGGEKFKRLIYPTLKGGEKVGLWTQYPTLKGGEIKGMRKKDCLLFKTESKIGDWF